MWRKLTVLSVYGPAPPGMSLAISHQADAGSPNVTFVVNKASTGLSAEGGGQAAHHNAAHVRSRRRHQPQPE